MALPNEPYIDGTLYLVGNVLDAEGTAYTVEENRNGQPMIVLTPNASGSRLEKLAHSAMERFGRRTTIDVASLVASPFGAFVARNADYWSLSLLSVVKGGLSANMEPHEIVHLRLEALATEHDSLFAVNFHGPEMPTASA